MGTREHLEDMPHYVYRYYSADDEPLYIGCTINVRSRERSHREKAWWPLVARREVERFPNRTYGLMAEAAAIQREAPRFNRRLVDFEPTEAGLRLAEQVSRNPERYAEFRAEFEATADLEPAPWDYLNRQRVERERLRRRLAYSKYRADLVARIQARKRAS